MMNEQQVRSMVRSLVEAVVRADKGPVLSKEAANPVAETAVELYPPASRSGQREAAKEKLIDDVAILTEISKNRATINQVENSFNSKALDAFVESTTARIAIGRTGPRINTKDLIRFRADHAAAKDAVIKSVSEDTVIKLGTSNYTTLCKDKDEFLTRPDLGRAFDEASLSKIKNECIASPDVQIIIADGLSATAIESNAYDALCVLKAGLEDLSLKIGTPVFVKYARVGCMDAITEAVNAKVTCLMIGERPGLASAESMSFYMTYQGSVGMPESRRNVISNIHAQGTNAAEASAHTVTIIERMLKEQNSGVDFQI